MLDVYAYLFGVLVGFIAGVWMCYGFTKESGYKRLARQIAEGTHKVEHTTNAFGTMEWRVVGVEEGTEDGS